MKNLKKISLEDEINREGKQIEDEIRADQELEDIKVSDDLESALFNKIQEYEFDKKVTTIVRKKKRRTYVLVGIAAVLIMMLGSVMTAVGSKSYGKLSWDEKIGDENATGIDVEDMESKETEDIDEISVYKEIKKKLGFSPVRMLYKPKQMILKKYIIDEEQESAVLLFQYNNQIIKYSMYKNDLDSSYGKKEVDDLIDEYEIENSNGIAKVEEYRIKSAEEKRFIGKFEDSDIHYQLKGCMKKEEFDDILKNLFFY